MKKMYEKPEIITEELMLSDVIASSGNIKDDEDWSLDSDDFGSLWGLKK